MNIAAIAQIFPRNTTPNKQSRIHSPSTALEIRFTLLWQCTCSYLYSWRMEVSPEDSRILGERDDHGTRQKVKATRSTNTKKKKAEETVRNGIQHICKSGRIVKHQVKPKKSRRLQQASGHHNRCIAITESKRRSVAKHKEWEQRPDFYVTNLGFFGGNIVELVALAAIVSAGILCMIVVNIVNQVLVATKTHRIGLTTFGKPSMG